MTASSMKVVVFGATGFVGGHVSAALERRGCSVRPMTTPRLAVDEDFSAEQVAALAASLRGADAVICAGGNPDASSNDEPALTAANATAPAMIAAAASQVGCPRFVYVSSAVVQGRRYQLDQTFDTEGFSAYARSKIAGEKAVRQYGPNSTVIYRPPSVHDASRRVTRMIARIATSPVSVVAAPGDGNSPQALIGNVADALAEIAMTNQTPPTVVIHPSEGITTSSLLRFLGGSEPRRMGARLARSLTTLATTAGRGMAPIAANARRLDMILFGQDQAASWLTEIGWTPVHGHDAWRRLGQEMRSAR